MRKLFIVGCGRSGTTMLQQALNRHSRIVIPPETGYFIDFLGHTGRGQAHHWRRIKADLKLQIASPTCRIHRPNEAVAFYNQIAQAYLERLDRRDALYFGDKSPHHVFVLPRIARLFSNAKFLLVYRDGRDVALSLSQVPWAPDDLFVNFAIWLRCHRWHQWSLTANVDFLYVKYEELATDPESQLKRICTFLDVGYEPTMAEGHGNREGIPAWENEWKQRAAEPISTSRIALWREALLPTEAAMLETWGGDALKSLGYDVSPDAPRRLPPGFFPRLWYRQTAWRARCAVKLLQKELLGR